MITSSENSILLPHGVKQLVWCK